jgi:hypothetical protein
MLAVTPLMGATSLYRAGVGYANAWYKQTPGLVGLWFDAVEPGGDQVASATELRARLLQTARESISSANDELTGGIEDLERFGAPPGAKPAGAGPPVAKPAPGGPTDRPGAQPPGGESE